MRDENLAATFMVEDRDHKEFKLEVWYDEYLYNPREDDNVATMVNWDRRVEFDKYVEDSIDFMVGLLHSLGDKKVEAKEYSKPERERLLNLLYQRDDIAILGIELYDHSGYCLGEYKNNCFPDRMWDVSFVGVIYVTKDKAFNEYGGLIEDNWKAKALDHLRGELNNQDLYVRGDCYGYTEYEKYHQTVETKKWIDGANEPEVDTYEEDFWEEIDSCGGYLLEDPKQLVEELGFTLKEEL